MDLEQGTLKCSDAENMANMRASLEALQRKYEKECAVRRELLNQLTEVKGNIRVLGRIRPLQESEDPSPLEFSDDWTIHAPLSALPSSSSTTPVLTSSTSAPSLHAMLPTSSSTLTSTAASSSSASSLLNKKYQFDRVFGPTATQSDVYEEVSTLSTSLLDGYNCCLFAYGQTGSGKTHTMEGPVHDRGLNYRLLNAVFSEAFSRESTQNMHFEFTTSIMEIYNDAIVDLLDQTTNQAKMGASIAAGGLKLRLGDRGMYVPDATRIRTQSLDQIEEVMEIAKSVRAVASTDMNEHSSRSHCITCVEVCGRKVGMSPSSSGNVPQLSKSLSSSSLASNSSSSDQSDTVVYSKLFLVDLAGSERIAQSGAHGKALEEAKHINKSLSALARVMECLQLKRQHIPFRDSTLTHLLKDALVDAKTVMVLNLSPAAASYGQTMNSLNFGIRVRKIERAAPKKNFDIDRDRYNAEKEEMLRQISHLKTEVTRLSTQISASKSDSSMQLQAINLKHEEAIAALKQQHALEIAALTSSHSKEVATLKQSLANINSSLAVVASSATYTNTSKAIARPTPAAIAANILNSAAPTLIATTPSHRASSKLTKDHQTHTSDKENVEEPTNQDSTSSLKDKLAHQKTPIKAKVVSNVMFSLLDGATPLMHSTPIAAAKTQSTSTSRTPSTSFPASPSSKLSSPLVVVDELQQRRLKQQAPVDFSLAPGAPSVDAYGVLIPVVMTPQVQRKPMITTASPLDFSGLASSKPSSGHKTPSIFDDEFIPATSSNVSSVTSQESTATSQKDSVSLTENAKSSSAEVSQTTTILASSTVSSSSTSSFASSGIIAPQVEPSTSDSNISLPPTAVVPPAISTTIANTSSTVVSSTISMKKSTVLRSCLLDRAALVGRAKKSVSFSDTLELFDACDVTLPIRRPTMNQATQLRAAAASTPVRASPASPIKSVAVRPTGSSSSSFSSSSSSSSSSSLSASARRVVAKSTAPRPTPARVRPIGRTAQPLSGPATVYKTY